MSHSIRCLNTSLRASPRALSGPSRAAPSGRRHMHAALQTKSNEPTQRADRTPRRHESGARAASVELDEADVAELRPVYYRNAKPAAERASAPKLKLRTALQRPASSFEAHLNGLFHPLEFPPELARRIMTHGSHPKAALGHNAGLTFMGRRVLQTYLHLFLSSSPNLRPEHDLDAIVDRVMNSNLLGEHIGNKWGLGRNMLWQPTVPRMQKAGSEPINFVKTAGLYRVQGDCVAAILGGVFHQYGGTVAHRLFHTRLLPRLIDGDVRVLPEVFIDDVRRAQAALGGGNAPLLSSDTQPAKVSSSVESNVDVNLA